MSVEKGFFKRLGIILGVILVFVACWAMGVWSFGGVRPSQGAELTIICLYNFIAFVIGLCLMFISAIVLYGVYKAVTLTWRYLIHG